MASGAVSDWRPEAVRKLLHLAVSAVPVLYAHTIGRGALLAVLGTSTAVALLVEFGRWVSPDVNGAFNRVIGALLRDRERRGLTGATWLCIAGFTALLLLDRRPAVAALWCATVGDPVAALAGHGLSRLRDRRRTAGKTIEGSVACAAVSFIGVWLLAGYRPLPALAVAIAAALAERYTCRLDDNATIPAVAGGLATLLT